MPKPELSIVVAIVDGGDALAKCLEAVAAQTGDHTLEVIVPYDQLSLEAETLAPKFPQFRFINLGVVAEGMKPANALELHRYWDIRRAEGLKAATGALIGLIEDRGVPKPDWSTQMIALHKGEAAAIGGAVENGIDRPWNWAVHICDFSRYQPPVVDENPELLSSTNIVYKRSALNGLEHLYEAYFYEPSLHGALKDAGHKMLLHDGPLTVQYRPRIGSMALFGEWYHWGRKYGQILGHPLSPLSLTKRLVITPVLPALFFFRHYKRMVVRKQADKFFKAAPLVFLIGTGWAIGECVGLVQSKFTNDPGAR